MQESPKRLRDRRETLREMRRELAILYDRLEKLEQRVEALTPKLIQLHENS